MYLFIVIFVYLALERGGCDGAVAVADAHMSAGVKSPFSALQRGLSVCLCTQQGWSGSHTPLYTPLKPNQGPKKTRLRGWPDRTSHQERAGAVCSVWTRHLMGFWFPPHLFSARPPTWDDTDCRKNRRRRRRRGKITQPKQPGMLIISHCIPHPGVIFRLVCVEPVNIWIKPKSRLMTSQWRQHSSAVFIVALDVAVHPHVSISRPL